MTLMVARYSRCERNFRECGIPPVKIASWGPSSIRSSGKRVVLDLRNDTEDKGCPLAARDAPHLAYQMASEVMASQIPQETAVNFRTADLLSP